jgi:hypothetical protein
MDGKLNSFTASMLMNKTSYNKYLEKTAPKAHHEKLEYLRKLKKYKTRIRELVSDYLENPLNDYSLEVNASLCDLGKTAIKYLEIKDLDKAGGGCYETDMPDDPDDTMFALDETCEFNLTTAWQKDKKKPATPSYSFWGKPIKKSSDFIGTRNTYSHNDQTLYTKNKEKSEIQTEDDYGEYDETKEKEDTEEDLA